MTTFHFEIISLMPEAFSSFLNYGIIGRAFEDGLAELKIYNPRDFTLDRYNKVDDQPYGGGPGMVLKPEPYFRTFESIPINGRRRVLMMSPQGHKFNQNDINRWHKDYDQLVIICGNYEGFDERIRTLVDEEISLGDFVMTGGELPSMALMNCLVRVIPGTIGCPESLEEESHTNFLLEHPHYTRPAIFRDLKVPEILKSGNHKAVAEWRQKKKEHKTRLRRPDLYAEWLFQKSFISRGTDYLNSLNINLLIQSAEEPTDFW